MGVFVASDDFSGAFIDVVQFVHPAAHENGVHCRCGHAECRADRDGAEALFPPQMPDLSNQGLRCAGRAGMRPGRPVLNSVSAHRGVSLGPSVAVGQDTLKWRAAVETGQPSSIIRRAMRKRCFGVRAALAWDMMTFLVRE